MSKAKLTPEEKAKRTRRRRKAFRSFVLRLFATALGIYVLFFHIAGITQMSSGDMYPRVDAGDLVLFYRLEKTPKAQEIIVFEKAVNRDYSPMDVEEREKSTIRKALDWLGFKDPEDPEKKTFIARVVAGPGDRVEITDKQGLVINGNSMIESNIFYRTRPYMGEQYTSYPVTLGEGEWFVLCDFRNGGADSRFFGVVREEEILGTVITVMRRNNL